MKDLTPERRAEVVRLLNAIRSDLAELRAMFEQLQARSRRA
jgi:hypothetical protein